jgi:acyl carrier protein
MDLDSILHSAKRNDGSDFFNEEIAQSHDSSVDDSKGVEGDYDEGNESDESVQVDKTFNLSDDEISAVIELLMDKLDVDLLEIQKDADLVNDLGADNLDLEELTMELEKKFGITISEEDAENIRTVGDILAYLSNVL